MPLHWERYRIHPNTLELRTFFAPMDVAVDIQLSMDLKEMKPSKPLLNSVGLSNHFRREALEGFNHTFNMT